MFHVLEVCTFELAGGIQSAPQHHLLQRPRFLRFGRASRPRSVVIGTEMKAKLEAHRPTHAYAQSFVNNASTFR
jgi:hypothetical protein